MPRSFFSARVRPGEARVAGALAHGGVGDQRAGTRALGQPGGEVHGAAVVVAPAAQRGAVRDARVQLREVLALALGGVHQAQ